MMTHTLFPASNEVRTIAIETSQTLVETSTHYFTSTAQTYITINPPIETFISTISPEVTTKLETLSATRTTSTSETLPTTPPSWLTLTPSSTTTRSDADPLSTSIWSGESDRKSSSKCREADEHEKESGLFTPTEEQTTTLCEPSFWLLPAPTS